MMGRTTSRSGKREGLAPLMVYRDIIPFSPSVARVIRELQKLFPGIRRSILGFSLALGGGNFGDVRSQSAFRPGMFSPTIHHA